MNLSLSLFTSLPEGHLPETGLELGARMLQARRSHNRQIDIVKVMDNFRRSLVMFNDCQRSFRPGAEVDLPGMFKGQDTLLKMRAYVNDMRVDLALAEVRDWSLKALERNRYRPLSTSRLKIDTVFAVAFVVGVYFYSKGLVMPLACVLILSVLTQIGDEMKLSLDEAISRSETFLTNGQTALDQAQRILERGCPFTTSTHVSFPSSIQFSVLVTKMWEIDDRMRKALGLMNTVVERLDIIEKSSGSEDLAAEKAVVNDLIEEFATVFHELEAIPESVEVNYSQQRRIYIFAVSLLKVWLCLYMIQGSFVKQLREFGALVQVFAQPILFFGVLIWSYCKAFHTAEENRYTLNEKSQQFYNQRQHLLDGRDNLFRKLGVHRARLQGSSD